MTVYFDLKELLGWSSTSDQFVLKGCQHGYGYFLPKSDGITCIVLLYQYFCAFVSLEIFT